jgi:hypothetical protein
MPGQQSKCTLFYGFLLLVWGGRASPLEAAIDSTVALASGAAFPSQNQRCLDSLTELMLRNNVSTSADELRYNLTDEGLLRLGLLASIALISPWDQNPTTGHFYISEEGILAQAYHPSTSESDIMLCVVCSLLAIIVMFHITSAQQLFVQSPQEQPAAKAS